jgi:uncharacterized phage protein gp47/JayE
MPWTTPTLRQVRELTRDNVSTALSGAAMVANSVLRVMADAMGALAHLTLRYIDWLALQLLPDTAEQEWLDRHGQIWLLNSDASKGRKGATFAEGSIELTGTFQTVVPAGTKFAGGNAIEYETLEEVILGADATPVAVRALDGGAAGNLADGESVSAAIPIVGLDTTATVVELTGGSDAENDPDLRMRVLKRIQEPPMGGCKTDYELWALAVPGVTRAWCAPNEMGIGTVTIRFMCDDVRWQDNGLPNDDDIRAVTDYLDRVRPVAVKDIFIVAPIAFPVDVTIANLDIDNAAVRQRIQSALLTMFDEKAKPGQTIFKSWVGESISIATGEDHHDLTFENAIMPTLGHLPILGSIDYV